LIACGVKVKRDPTGRRVSRYIPALPGVPARVRQV
jgi:hypothetical protein